MISLIIKLITSKFLSTVCKVCNTVNTVFKFYIMKYKDEKKEKQKQELKEDFKTIDNVCNDGSINDLLNIGEKMQKIILICLLFLSGCIQFTPEVQTTKSWENHYKNTDDFYENTKNITLEKGESIWVLSNSSLSRLLKQIRK